METVVNLRLQLLLAMIVALAWEANGDSYYFIKSFSIVNGSYAKTLDDKGMYSLTPLLLNAETPEKGITILSQPPDACMSISPPPNFPSLAAKKEQNWVLLITWSPNNDCPLSTKIDNAVAAGYKFIVIQDPNPSPNHFNDSNSYAEKLSSAILTVNSSSTNVFACVLAQRTWKIFRNLTTINPNWHCVATFSKLTEIQAWVNAGLVYFRFSVLPVIAVFSITLFLLGNICLIIYICSQNFQEMFFSDRQRDREMPPEQAEPKPNEPDILLNQLTCAICLDHYDEVDSLGTLACYHRFHRSCIEKWMGVSYVCPVCRSMILPVKGNNPFHEDEIVIDEQARILQNELNDVIQSFT